MDYLRRELACVFLGYVNRQNVQGTVEHTYGDLCSSDLDANRVFFHFVQLRSRPLSPVSPSIATAWDME
jgi:hypothetical protein